MKCASVYSTCLPADIVIWSQENTTSFYEYRVSNHETDYSVT